MKSRREETSICIAYGQNVLMLSLLISLSNFKLDFVLFSDDGEEVSLVYARLEVSSRNMSKNYI